MMQELSYVIDWEVAGRILERICRLLVHIAKKVEV